jgi:hypothetical protein
VLHIVLSGNASKKSFAILAHQRACKLRPFCAVGC